MRNLHAIILCRNTAVAVGLKYLLRQYFNIEATFVNDTSHIDNSIDCNQDTLYLAETDIFAARHDFFIPRRSRTVIISNGEFYNSTAPYINTYADESSIIDDLRNIIGIYTQSNEIIPNELSQREIDVLRLVAMGYINKEIADILEISINTVLTHRKNITSKLGIRSVSGLGFYAIMHGYISDSDIRR